MIFYFRCACTARDKIRVKQLRDGGHEVRFARGDMRKEANQYKTKMPFVVIDEQQKIARTLDD